jgi:hypothetical protein
VPHVLIVDDSFVDGLVASRVFCNIQGAMITMIIPQSAISYFPAFGLFSLHLSAIIHMSSYLSFV